MNKKTMHPIITFLLLTCGIIILSGLLYILDFNGSVYSINSTTLEYSVSTVLVNNLFSTEGLKYIFSDTVSNFVSFTPLSSLIIILIGIGVMEKSGFLKTVITWATKKMRRNTVTFILIFVSIISSIMGDLSFIVIIPLSALIFKYGKRNPLLGIICAFAGLTCGQGLSIFFTSVDSSMLSISLTAARVIDSGYRFASISGLYIMAVASLILAYALTVLTEKVIAEKIGKYEISEEEEAKPMSRRELRGLLFSLFGGISYCVILLYNIVPGLPFSGNLLDNTQELYVDKLFSYDSFFSNGFVFIVTIFFLILGLCYGIGARTIKNQKDFVDTLGHSLDSIGKTLVLILFASVFISLFKYTNIGTIIVAYLGNLFQNINITGVPLIILLFLIVIIATIIVPTSVTKWGILAPVVIPVMMNAGITPEFTEVIVRFAESVSFGLTPLMAYFVIYLAFLNEYTKKEENIGLFEAIRFQVPYAVLTAIILICLLILWYLTGLPIGINGSTVL